MKKIKFLYALSSLNGGGAEKVGVTLLRNFDKNKYDFDLFLHKTEGQYFNELPLGLRVRFLLKGNSNVFLSKIKSFVTLPFLFVKLIIIAKDYDLLIAGLESTYITYATIISGIIRKKPVIVTVHNDICHNKSLQNFHRKLIKILYPYCSHCVCVSNGVLQGIAEHVPQIKNRISIIYNPFELKNIEKQSIETINLSIDNPFIVSVGRLENQKRFDILINAHKNVLKSGIAHSLIIAGEGTNKKKLEDLIIELNLESSVHLIGFDENPHKWVSKSYCFVLSSENEGFGNVIVEALAVGTPVISTNCPSGPSEILANGKYGVLVENENVQQLSDEIISMFKDKKKHKHYKDLSKSRSEDFSAEKAIAKWEILFDIVFANKKY
jgi:glycosyltransferase involved in cell wall biosynthesis